MSTRTFIEFKNKISKHLHTNSVESREFRKVLGKVVSEKIPDDTKHDKLVEQAIDLTGAQPGRKNIDLSGYGHALILNNIKHGTASYDVSLALYYLLLRLEDTPKYEYSSCVYAIDEYIFGKGNSFAKEFPNYPLPPIASVEYPELKLSWTLFLEKYAQFQDIKVELEKKPKRRALSITDIKSNMPVFDKAIKVGQGFRFHLNIPLTGIGLVLQAEGSKTYPLRYSHDQLIYKSQGEKMIFPLQQNEPKAGFLSETKEQETQFLFIIANRNSGQVLIDHSNMLKVGTEISSGNLDRLAHDLTSTAGNVEVRRIIVEFQR